MTSTPVNDGVPAGKTAAGLLAQAETLTSAADTGAIYTRLTGVVADLNALSVTLAHDRTAETQATHALRVASDGATAARRDYRALTAALKGAAIRLYMTGPELAIPHNISSANQLLYASSYEETALSPQGILDRRRLDVTIEKRSLAKARAMATLVAADTRRVQAEMAALGTERKRLTLQLASFNDTTGAAVASEEQTLAAQASKELLSPSALEVPSTSGSSASPGSAPSSSSAPSALVSSSPPPTPLSTTQIALQWAFAELGKPYLWGGTGPDAFDCSGLTQFVWAQAGVSIPRVSEDQYAWAIPVSLSQLLPGDLVFFGTTDIHHVGIYIGGGLMINAPHTGTVVQISSIWWSDLAGFGRVHAPGVPVPAHAVPTPANPATPAVVPSAGPVPSESTPPPGSAVPGSTTPTRPASSPAQTSGSPAASTTVPKAPTTTSPTTITPPTVAPPPDTTTSTGTTPPPNTTPPSDATPPTDTTPPTTTPPSGTTPATTAPPSNTTPTDSTLPSGSTPPSDTTTAPAA